MRIGIKTSQAGYSYRELSQIWRRADELGFDSAFLYDHLSGVGNPKDDVLEAYSTLAALARDTAVMKIGIMATNVMYRNPALLAKISSTVDQISNGRLILGLGLGWNEPEIKSYGYSFATVRERINQLLETIKVVKMMWCEERPTFNGANHSIESALNYPKPVQKYPPIWIGIMTGTNTLPRIAVKYADGFNTTSSLDLCKKMIYSAEDERITIGARRDAYTYSLQASVLTGSDIELQKIADFEAPRRSMTKESYFETLKKEGWLVGSPEYVAGVLEDYLKGGIDYLLIAVGSDRLGWPLEVVKDRLVPLLRSKSGVYLSQPVV